ncbi:MAG: hypothetical protein V3T84_08570 [Phycisphaerales bacterium]
MQPPSGTTNKLHCGRPVRLHLATCATVVVWCAILKQTNGSNPPEPEFVQVIVDMDASRPGRQSSISVPVGTTIVRDVSVYVLDPRQQNAVWGIGFVGGIDRGIAFGHMPDEIGNQGTVAEMTGRVDTPVNPGNFAVLAHSPGLDPGFVGPEVQYIEAGAGRPAVIPADPPNPIFTVDIALEELSVGDVFDFYLLDFITVWSQQNSGAFCTLGPNSLDSGGDAVLDGTQTIYGPDPDPAIPVPPAAFLVDYVDGPKGGGPATINVRALGDLDGDGTVGASDLLILLVSWGPCGDCKDCPADLNGDCTVGAADLLILLVNWG